MTFLFVLDQVLAESKVVVNMENNKESEKSVANSKISPFFGVCQGTKTGKY